MIRVLLFANLQEEAGRSELQIEKENITVAELKVLLQLNIMCQYWHQLWLRLMKNMQMKMIRFNLVMLLH